VISPPAHPTALETRKPEEIERRPFLETSKMAAADLGFHIAIRAGWCRRGHPWIWRRGNGAPFPAPPPFFFFF